MEPKQAAPTGGYERPLVSQEAAGNQAVYDAEVGVQGTVERAGERTHEGLPLSSEAASAPAQVMPSLPIPLPVADDTTQTTSVLPTDDSGLIAGDDDLIEKEWVEKAKKILLQTKDDPYKREQEVSKLQVEYIRKRYGRTISDAGQ